MSGRLCPSCLAGQHHHDRHTGVLAPEGTDAGCPYRVDGAGDITCYCPVVLPPIPPRPRHCPTCTCSPRES